MSEIYDHELECCTLGWMIEHSELIPQTSLNEGDFHNKNYREIFNIIKKTFDEKGFIDKGILKARCGDSIPKEAIDDVINSETKGGLHYADEIKRFTNTRKLKKLIDDTREMIDDSDPKAIEKFEEEFHQIQKGFEIATVPMSADEMMDSYEEHWGKLTSGKSDYYFRSGYRLIDDYLAFQRKKLYTLAARSSIGKTSLAQTMGIGFSKRKAKVLYFSAEQDYIELSERMLSIYSNLSNTMFKYGNVKREKLNIAMSKFKEHQKNFFLHWDPSLTLPKINRVAYDMKHRNGLDVIIVDYLQFIKPHYNMRQGDNMHHFISMVSAGLKRLAGELNCAVIQLSQVSRSQNEDEPPRLNQLKESGSIENDSDAVMMLHRISRDAEDGVMVIAKNRSGPAEGTINLDFVPHLTLYKESDIQTLKPVEIGKKLKDQLRLDLE